MNVIAKHKIANNKDFKIGDLVKITEVSDNDTLHKEYCIKNGIKTGTIMRVYHMQRKDQDELYCKKHNKVICNQINKDYCMSLEKVDDTTQITHSCYSKFIKIDKDEYKENK